MRYRFLAAVFATCLIAMGQSLSVEKLVAFLQSSEKLIKEGKMTDHDLASYLTKVKLTERLDDRTIEEIQGYGKIGPKTLQALTSLRDRTQALAAAAPIVAPPKPTPIPPPPGTGPGPAPRPRPSCLRPSPPRSRRHPRKNRPPSSTKSVNMR